MDFYNNYFNDIEHGLFHSISACYVYYIFNKNKLDERTVASLLLHDFLKCSGFSQEKHDRELINYFPNLLPETYTHSNPPDENKLLVKSDRIELRRFNDYKDWVDNRHYRLYDEIDENKKQDIETFYNNIKPTLEYFYKNRNEIFIRHGLENIDKCDVNNVFPPSKSFLVVDKLESYPIEIDRIPFGYIKTNNPGQRGFCSNHGASSNWNRIKGYITYKEFINNGGKIINTKERDHLYATSNINIKNWKFLYQNVKKDDGQKVELEKNNINIVSTKVISDFFMFMKLFQDRLVVLNNTT